MSLSSTAPSFLLKKGKSSGALKTPEERRSESLTEFQAKFREVNPLMIKAMEAKYRKDPQKRIANLVRLQEDALKRALKEAEVQSDLDVDLHGRYPLLASSIASSIAKAPDLKRFKTMVGHIAKVASKAVEGRADDLWPGGKDEAFLSDDAAVNIKINTIEPALAFSQTLSSLGLSRDGVDDAIRSQVDVAISMAKDLCFNHEPKASIWDRERLFTALIGPCMNSVRDAWESLATKQFPSSAEVKVFTPEYIACLLSVTREAIESDDMGHEDQVSATLDELAGGIFHYLHIGNRLELSASMKQAILARQISIIDNHLAESWNRAADGIREYVENLDEDALSSWIETEGARPMSLGKVWDALDSKKLLEELNAPMDLKVDQKELVGESFYRLIQAWGLTDTLCGQNE